jgi:flagellar motility protein MotE (MotC chaperone)
MRFCLQIEQRTEKQARASQNRIAVLEAGAAEVKETLRMLEAEAATRLGRLEVVQEQLERSKTECSELHKELDVAKSAAAAEGTRADVACAALDAKTFEMETMRV